MGHVRTYQVRLQSEWNAFETAHALAYDAATEVQAQDQMQLAYSDLDSRVMEAQIQLCNRLDALTLAVNPRPPLNEPTAIRQPRGLANLKLDKVQINKFDGDITNWPSFKHEFLTFVHNSKELVP